MPLPALAAPPNDYAPFQPPKPLDPAQLKLEAGIVRRDIPILVVNTGWTPPDIRAAFVALVAGIFDPAAQLIDSLVGDSRVMSGLESRVGGLLGRPVDFSLPPGYEDSDLARECLRAFVAAWPTLAAEPQIAQLQTWAILLGHGHAQMVWDTSGAYAIPHPQVWHPRYTYFDWTLRRVMAITQDEGPIPMEGGDGHWIEHTPHGRYRGWMRGAVRAIAPWWLSRNYALTDASRWSEANGQPLLKLMYPATADHRMVERFRSTMANRGSETCADLPQGVPNVKDGAGANANFDIKFEAPPGLGFDGFFKLIDACDREITLALLAQTLTSSLPEGGASYAAARVHADVRQALIEADARALARTIYLHIARPFAAMNFGNPDLAPLVGWNVEPYEDAKTKASTLLTWTQAMVNLTNAGLELDPEDARAIAAALGLKVGRMKRIAAAPSEGTGARFAPPPGAGARIAPASMAGREFEEAAAEIEAVEALRMRFDPHRLMRR